MPISTNIFFDECIEVMKLGFWYASIKITMGIIIPSFINWGVKEEDAYNYSAIGCVETAVPGKWDIVVPVCLILTSQEFCFVR